MIRLKTFSDDYLLPYNFDHVAAKAAALAGVGEPFCYFDTPIHHYCD
jgi:hypothetical protein